MLSPIRKQHAETPNRLLAELQQQDADYTELLQRKINTHKHQIMITTERQPTTNPTRMDSEPTIPRTPRAGH